MPRQAIAPRKKNEKISFSCHATTVDGRLRKKAAAPTNAMQPYLHFANEFDALENFNIFFCKNSFFQKISKNFKFLDNSWDFRKNFWKTPEIFEFLKEIRKIFQEFQEI